MDTEGRLQLTKNEDAVTIHRILKGKEYWFELVSFETNNENENYGPNTTSFTLFRIILITSGLHGGLFVHFTEQSSMVNIGAAVKVRVTTASVSRDLDAPHVT